MCNIVVINNGEKEITTPKEFLEHFGFEAILEPYCKEVFMDGCLCHVDLEKTFTEHGISFTEDCGDYYIEQPIN